MTDRAAEEVRRGQRRTDQHRTAPCAGPDDPPVVPGLTRMDMHVHSRASSGPAYAALGLLGCAECYSDPEEVFDQARARGMDLVTLTDHDTIAGALELVERGFPGVVIGEEVTVHFPEDRCKLHVLVWGLSPEQHEQIGGLRLRDDVYAFAQWLRAENLAHALAHPLYIQNGRLTRRHIERCVLLFKGFETLNGAHSGTHRGAIESYLDALTPAVIHRLSIEHELEPHWPRVWEKGRVGGSDDHGLLNVGRAWTAVIGDDGKQVLDPRLFLKRVMGARCEPGGIAGHSSLLAHQLCTVGARFAGKRLADRADYGDRGLGVRGRYVAGKLLRFAGVRLDPVPRTGLGAVLPTLRLAASAVGSRLSFRRRRTLPILSALRGVFGPVLERHPAIREKLDPATWATGAPLSSHSAMAAFVDDLSTELARAMADGTLAALRKRDRQGIIDAAGSYLLLLAAQSPYLLGLFYQNKERVLVDTIAHDAAALRGDRAPADNRPITPSPLERPMRVALFTDTLGDVNGVSRFIRNVAEQAHHSGRDLRVITSTRLPVPNLPNIHNFEPVFATAMPRYQNLELVLPPILKVLRFADEHQPDVIHISTPGPVGVLGMLAAKMLRVPVLGVYHTDFPAYVDHLFQDHAFTWMSSRFMRLFYGPFAAIFTRSEDYVRSLVELGIRRERVLPLVPGIDTDHFHRRHRDGRVWDRFIDLPGGGVSSASVKVLYVGRVSVEKNMPLLVSVWRQVHARCLSRGLDAELVIVGDGPYRQRMERDLRGTGAHFLGFRHGDELAAIYASSDLFIFPSTTDTLGQVVMESQASGVPVLVSDEGGPKEVVADGECGHVLPAGRPERWADAAFRLIADGELRRRMGEAAFHAMQRCSIRASFEQFWEVHARVRQERLAANGIGVAGSTPTPTMESPAGAGAKPF